MATVVTGMMTMSSNLYVESRESAKIYEDLQDYRATCELACYQYITELCTVQLRQDLSAGWVDDGPSIAGNAVFTQAVETIFEYLMPAEEDATSHWYVESSRDALASCGVADASLLTDLVAKLSDEYIREEFLLKLPEPIKLVFDPETSYSGTGGAKLSIKPFKVVISLGVRGETTTEVFTVSGLNLVVDIQKEMNALGQRTEVAYMFLEESTGGVSITRDYSEETSE